jgi:hypothetical protein
MPPSVETLDHVYKKGLQKFGGDWGGALGAMTGAPTNVPQPLIVDFTVRDTSTDV